MQEQAKILPIKSISDAVEDAKALIEVERSGNVNGLVTRWSGINRAKFKYWRFRNVTLIAGGSGSGKSAILNMIEDDFTNPELNGVWQKHIMVLAFKFEMDAADEILRNLSGKAKKSYAYLLSSQIDTKASTTPDHEGKVKDVYNRISDSEYQDLVVKLDALKSKPIKYIENSGNINQIWATCAAFKEKHPDKKLIVTLDHSLLTDKLSEKDDLELMSHIGKLAIRLKKTFDALVIYLGQLNGEIEKSIRRDNPNLHYPMKTDIHCGNQVFWACDDVLVFHRPELLHIDKYGTKPFPMATRGLVHCAWLKSRKNTSGSIWFRERFNEGNMDQIKADEMKWQPVKSEFS